jgi:alpha-glucosidase
MASSFILLLLCAGAVLGQIPRPAANCPGYRATNVQQHDSYLLADLVLIGSCNLHSNDVQNLRLLVEYQTGEQNDFLNDCCN